MGVEVGSAVKVAVGVLSTGTTSTGWDVDVISVCPTGADGDAAGLAQADRNMIIANNRDAIRFMVPLHKSDSYLQGDCHLVHVILGEAKNLCHESKCRSQQALPQSDMPTLQRSILRTMGS